MAALIAIGALVVFAMGYAFGRMERKQRRECELSDLRSRAALADLRLLATREANRSLSLKAAVASSPLN
jgi:hypothetical protein